MKKITKQHVLALLATLVLYPAKAQQAVGLETGNHNTPYSAFFNPANTYSDRNRAYLNIWGAGMGLTSNTHSYNAPFSIYKWAGGNVPDAYKNPDGSEKFSQDWINFNRPEKGKTYFLSEVYGPSLFFRLDRIWGMGFGIRAVSGLSANGFSGDFATLSRYGLDSLSKSFTGENALQYGQWYDQKKFSVSADNYQEYFFSLAKVTRDRGNSFFKWGATAKFLLGMGAAHIGGSGMEFNVEDKNNLQLRNAKLNYFHTDDASASTALSNPLGMNFNSVQGAGAGFDLGFVYENRNQASRKFSQNRILCVDEQYNDYNWKFGASITDIGFLAYSGSQRKLDISGAQNWTINRDLMDAQAYRNFGEDRFNKIDTGFFDKMGAEKKDGFAVTTPMAFNAQLDLNFKNNFYLAFNLRQSLKGADAYGLKRSSYLSIVPRWEAEHSELGLPLTFTQDYSAFNIGLYGRLGPVVLGTDNLAGLAKSISGGSFSSGNIYAALRFKIATCPRTEYNHDTLTDRQIDSMMNDTTVYYDTTRFWEGDTIILRDTVWKERVVYKERIVRDTIYKTRIGEAPPDYTKREAELKKREDVVKAKEEELKRREEALKNTNMGTGGNNDYNKALTEISVLRTENDKLKQEIARLKLNSNPCDKQVKSVDSLLNIEREKRLAVQRELDKLKIENQATKNAKVSSDKKVSDLEIEIARLKASATGDAEKLKKLQADLDAEKAKNALLAKEKIECEKNFAAALVKIKDLEDKLKAASGPGENCDEYKAKVAQLEKELADLKAQYKEATQTITVLNDAIYGYKKAIVEKDNKIKSLEADLVVAGNKESDYKSKIAELEAKLKECGGNGCEELEMELKQVKSDLQQANDAKASIKAEYDDMLKAYNALKKELEDCKQKLANCTAGDQTAEINKLKSDIDKLKQTITELNGQLDSKDESLKSLQESYHNLETKNKTQEDQIRQLQSDIAGLKAQLLAAQEALKECQSK